MGLFDIAFKANANTIEIEGAFLNKSQKLTAKNPFTYLNQTAHAQPNNGQNHVPPTEDIRLDLPFTELMRPIPQGEFRPGKVLE